MTQLKSPLIWRLILWFLLLSLIPVGVVLVFVQRQVRNTVIDQQIQGLSDQASLLALQIADQPEKAQTSIEKFGTEAQTAFLLDENGNYVAHSIPSKVGGAASFDINSDILQQLLTEPFTKIDNSVEEQYIGSARLEVNNNIVVITADSTAKVKNIDNLSRVIILQLAVSLLITSLAGGAAIVVVLNPIVQLSRFADLLAAGELETEFDTAELEGEVATLAQSLNNLAVKVRDAIATLEQRVEERTAELQERATQLRTIAEASQTITGIRNLNELLPRIADLISQRFEIYHTGIFLADDRGEYAVLQAANSVGGQNMLARGHRLKIGAQGIVGYVTSTGQPRVALDVGEDAVYFDNPDLPDTRSEIALPLKVAGQTFGALDLQSTQPNAFGEEDIQTLSILADQVAIAIQNARSFEQSRQATEEAEIAYRQMTGQTWRQVSAQKNVLGYEYDGSTLKSIREVSKDESSLNIPLVLRGQIIGKLKLSAFDPDRNWTDDELAMAQAIAERTALTLEAARLLEDAQRRAAREQAIGEITASISASSDVDSILRTAVQELGNKIGNTEVIFELGTEREAQ